MKRLVEIVRTHPYSKAQSAPQVIVVAPPLVENFGPTPELPLLASRTRDIEKLADIYAKVAAAAGVEFFDAARVASPKGGGDGVHLDVNNTRALGEALVPLAARLLDTKARGDR
jgi:lysophospholipase L1-like esterase